MSGLLLKNCMTSKDHAQAVKLAKDWMGLDPQARTQIKTCRLISKEDDDLKHHVRYDDDGIL